MSYSTAMIRIMKDLIDLKESPPDGIYIYINEKDIYKNYALIMGPKNTPYFGGFFFFEINFPENYPTKPPKVKFLTIDGKVRFNPNLYQCGKVCLSILGTWSGPSWRPIMTLRSVLLSINSLMGEFPINNEPGWEKIKPDHISSINYNMFITFYTYKIGIIDVLTGKFKKLYKMFKNEINQEYKKNKEDLLNDLLSYQSINKCVVFEKRPIYFIPNNSKLDFNKLLKDFKNFNKKLKDSLIDI